VNGHSQSLSLAMPTMFARQATAMMSEAESSSVAFLPPTVADGVASGDVSATAPPPPPPPPPDAAAAQRPYSPQREPQSLLQSPRPPPPLLRNLPSIRSLVSLCGLFRPRAPAARLEMPVPAGCPFAVNLRRFEDFYAEDRELGRGGFGRVFVATRLADGARVAVKVISKARFQYAAQLLRIYEEIRIMFLLNDPHCVRLLEAFDNPDAVYLVMELMDGGDLFNYIAARFTTGRVTTEQEVARLLGQAARGLRRLHEHGVVHGDIKPENLLLTAPDDGTAAPPVLKIADFGLSRQLRVGEKLSLEGTVDYMAPEVLARTSPADSRADMWSLGVVAFCLFFGFHPFTPSERRDPADVRRRIIEGRIAWPAQSTALSEHARLVVTQLLAPDPAARLTAEQLVAHCDTWVESGAFAELRSGEEFKRMYCRRRALMAFRRAMLAVVAVITIVRALASDAEADAAAGATAAAAAAGAGGAGAGAAAAAASSSSPSHLPHAVARARRTRARG
jgi:tRNA A-37 threonylcarbamoyl transferase component Bud32